MRKLLILAALLPIFLLAGCTAKRTDRMTKAYNTVNAVSEVRNGLQPIYAKVVEQYPDLEDEIVAFDLEFYSGIQSAFRVLVLIENKQATFADYVAQVKILVEIIDQHRVTELVPEIKPAIDLAKALLGVA